MFFRHDMDGDMAVRRRERVVGRAGKSRLPIAGALILMFPYVKTQVGLAAVLIVMALVAQRVLSDAHPLVPAKAATE